jgi:RNA polymerase sigma-70 factor, ECF subfamily
MPEDGRELVRRFRNGEAGAFERLYDEYGDRVYRFCFRLCGQAADAEDLTQEVFIAAYQGLDRFAGRSSLATWLYRIALYRWRGLQGAAPPTVPLELEPEGTAAVPDPAPSRIERLSLESAIARLPESLRDAFLLVKSEGLKYREAARVLGVPQGTVQSRVHDAIVRLRVLLAEEGRDPLAASDRQAEAEDSRDQKGQSPHLCRGESLQP